MNLYSHAGRPKFCKNDGHYPALCTTRGATPGNTFNKNLQKKKEKPKIQVQILKLDKISGVLWDVANIGIMLLQGRNSMFRRTIFQKLCIISMFRDKQTQALMKVKRRPSMIIGTWMETSHCLNLGSMSHDSRCSKKSTMRIYVGSWLIDEETGHKMTRKHLARRMVKHVRWFTA